LTTEHPNTDLLATIKLATDPLAADLRELRGLVTNLMTKLTTTVAKHDKAINTIRDLQREQKALAIRINKVEDAITYFKQVTKVLQWIALAFGGMLVALLWNIFTGQVDVIFK